MRVLWAAGFGWAILAACSGGGDSAFHGTTRKLLSPPRVASDAAVLEPPPVATPPPMPVVALETPPPASVPTLPPAQEAIVVEPELQSRTGQGVVLRWGLSAEVSGLRMFHVSIFDSQDTIVYEKDVAFDESRVSGSFAAAVDSTLPEGDFRVEVSGVAGEGAFVRGAPGRLLIDSTPPVTRLYIGAERSADVCTVSPGERQWVATRVVSYDFCATDAQGSGVEKICLKSGTDASELPAATDPCWVGVEAATRQLLLSSADGGRNRFVLFSRDKLGNVGRDLARSVTLVKTTPPRVDILKPTAKEISTTPWQAGEVKELKWEIIDDDTPYEDIRVLVTVLETNNHAKFRHLACNFANTKVFRQCPDASLEKSSLISSDGSNRGTFRFQVPSDWNSSTLYSLVVTAIDKAGNAAVASTQEINAPWEVLAGRTYKGLGGSGVTLERSRMGLNIATDRLGQLYDINANLKLNAFDLRSCRFTRKSSQPPGPFDCPDILVTDLNITGRWVYVPSEDVFHTIVLFGSKYLLMELDFKAGTVRHILGGGTTELGRDTPSGSIAAQFAIPKDGLGIQIFHETLSRRTYLMAAGMLFHVGGVRGQERVSYVLGSGWEEAPADQINVAQRDLKLPKAVGVDANKTETGPTVLAISKDNRILISSREPRTWPHGGGAGLQYFSRSFSPSDPSASVSMEVLPPLAPRPDGLVDPKVSGPSRTAESLVIGFLDYRPETDEFLATMASSYYLMSLPAVGSDRTAYKWTKLADVPLGQANGISRIPGTPLYFLSDAVDGKVWSYDLSEKSLDMVLGFDTGAEGSGLGQNRYLDMPLHVQVLGDGEVWFNDFYNLQSVALSDAWRISTRVEKYGLYPFRVTPSLILQFGYGRWSVVPRAGGTAKVFTLNPAQIGYDLQFALGNDMSRPKGFGVTSLYDNVSGSVYDGKIYLSQASLSGDAVTAATSVRASAFGTLDAIRCGNPLAACVQGKEKTTIAGDVLAGPGVSYFDGAEYHLTPLSGTYSWHSHVSTAAFDASDRFVFSCFWEGKSPGRFMWIDSESGRLYPFVANVVGGGEITPCSSGNPHFIFMNISGQVYLEIGSTFYQLKNNTVLSNNRMEFERMPVSDKARKGAVGGFWVTSDYLYYTDKINNRVFRVRK